MSGTLQIVGALLVLTPFALVQARRLHPDAVTYLLLNLVGAGILAVLAAAHEQWGFLLLEGVWAMVAGWSLARRRRRGDGGGARTRVGGPRAKSRVRFRGYPRWRAGRAHRC